MFLLRFYVLYRLPIIIALIILGVVLQLYVDPITAILCYVAAFISLVLYFMMGTMRLVQEAVQEGDIDKAMRYVKQIKYPKLLFKPIRAAYYMLQSNLALGTDDLEKAEENIRKGLNTKSTIMGDVKGANLMQLGFIQLKKGNPKEARLSFMQAIKAGITDKESLATVYLQLSSMEIQRNQNKVAKEYFKKAKALKPRTEELVKQIKLMDKQMSRLPG
jgi:tetratricopeptide (TPR) repeat protein